MGLLLSPPRRTIKTHINVDYYYYIQPLQMIFLGSISFLLFSPFPILLLITSRHLPKRLSIPLSPRPSFLLYLPVTLDKLLNLSEPHF